MQNDINPNDPGAISHMVNVLSKTYDPDTNLRQAAEKELRETQKLVQSQCGLLSLLLNIACGTQQQIPDDVRQQAGIVLKNTIKASWNAQMAEYAIQEREKAQVRDHLLSAMLHSPSYLREIMAECVCLVCNTDFPKQWPSLLPGIVHYLNPQSTMSIISSALAVAHRVFFRYKEESELTEQLKDELLEINGVFTLPLLHTMQYLVQQISSGRATAEQTKELIIALTNACSCYADLTALDMGQEHEDNMNDFMSVLSFALRYRNGALMGNEYNPGPVISLQSVAIECAIVHLEQYDEEFAPYVSTFTGDIWNLVRIPESSRPAFDDILITALEYLGCIARSSHHGLLTTEIAMLCETTIVPALQLRDDVEIEMFEDEPQQYIEREIEGSDVHTRRRASSELIRALLFRFEAQVSPILQNYCMQMLGGDWKSRDAAIYLITAMAVKGGSAAQRSGAQMELNPNVPIGDFYTSAIVPEIQTTDIPRNSHAILKADAIRFVATFRQFLDVQQYSTLIGQLAAWISHSHVVVHTYAAHAIEKVLQLKDNGQLRVSTQSFAQHAEAVLANLCQKLVSTQRPNEYMMRCLMVVLKLHPQAVEPLVGPVVNSLAQILDVQKKNPSNPIFNHCMWECLSYAIKLAPQHVTAIESILWTHLMYVLAEDVTAFLPYALQLIAQLLDGRAKAGEKDHTDYLSLYPHLVSPQMFEMKGTIPAITGLVTVFNRHCSKQLEAIDGMTTKTLAVYQNLLSLKQFDHEGFNVLAAMVMHSTPAVIDQFMTTALQLIFNRQQQSPTPKFTRCEVYMFAVITCHRGPDYFIGLVESIQNNLSGMLLEKVWLPNASVLHGDLERKQTVVALTRLVTENSVVANNTKVASLTLQTILKILFGEKSNVDVSSFLPQQLTVDDLTLDMEASTFTNQFCPLAGAALPPEDAAANVQDAGAFFTEACRSAKRGQFAQQFNAAVSALPPNMRQSIPQ